MAPAHSTPSQDDLDQLSAYLDGALTDRQRTALEQRLRSEPDLQAALDDLRQTVALLRGLPRLKAPRSFALDPARYARRAPRWQRSPLAVALQISGALGMAAAILLIAAALLVGRPPQPATAPSYPADVAIAQVPTETPLETAIAYAGEGVLQSTIAPQTTYYATREALTPTLGAVAANAGLSAMETAPQDTLATPEPVPTEEEALAFAAPPDSQEDDVTLLQAAPAPEQPGIMAAQGDLAAPPGAPAPLAAEAAGAPPPSGAMRDAQATPEPTTTPTATRIPTATRTAVPTAAPTVEPAPPLTLTKAHAESRARRTVAWEWLALGVAIGGASLVVLVAGYRWTQRR